jgi:hypothetical protein
MNAVELAVKTRYGLLTTVDELAHNARANWQANDDALLSNIASEEPARWSWLSIRTF